MSSCNCMLSGSEIATYTGTNVCMTIMQNDTYFTRKLCRWRTPSWFFKLICRGPLCLRWLPARISALRSSKPAVFSLFFLFLLVLFLFFWGCRTYLTYGIGYHFEKLSSPSGWYKKELISRMAVTMFRLFCIDWRLNATLSKPIHLNVSLLYVALL